MSNDPEVSKRQLVRTGQGESPRLNRKRMRELSQLCKVAYVSKGIFWSAKPFEVKSANRELCVCGYHLRWEYMSMGLHSYIIFLLKEKRITEEQHDAVINVLADPSAFRRAITCGWGEGEEYCNAACITRTCDACSDWQMLKGNLCYDVV